MDGSLERSMEPGSGADGTPKRFGLVRTIWAARTLGCLALVAAVPTVGAGLVVLAFVVPPATMIGLFGYQETSARIGLAAGALGALFVGVGLAVGLLRLGVGIAGWRTPFGELTVGREGVLVRAPLVRRPIHFRDVEEVDEDPARRDLVFRFHEGGEGRVAPRELELACDAVREALERYRAREPAPRIPALDATSNESDRGALEAWVGRARSLAREATYREASASLELLASLAEDPTASAAQRVGAALALGDLAEPLRARARAALGEIADPDLAAAMRDALDGTLRLARLKRVLRG